MMAFIEQEANEKAEEIDAKVYSDAYTQCFIKNIFRLSDQHNMLSLFPMISGGGRVQHRERSFSADTKGENHGIL